MIVLSISAVFVRMRRGLMLVAGASRLSSAGRPPCCVSADIAKGVKALEPKGNGAQEGMKRVYESMSG